MSILGTTTKGQTANAIENREGAQTTPATPATTFLIQEPQSLGICAGIGNRELQLTSMKVFSDKPNSVFVVKGITDGGWECRHLLFFWFLILDCGSNSDTNLANRVIHSSIRHAFEPCGKTINLAQLSASIISDCAASGISRACVHGPEPKLCQKLGQSGSARSYFRGDASNKQDLI